jgi:DNA-binding MarR family transcriptional regulator
MTTAPPPAQEIFEHALDRFWETIPPLWGNIRAHIRSLAAEQFAISVEQFHILRHIRRGHWSVSELAEAKNISRPAISQGVDLLVNKGLISRAPNPDDRRYVHLELTPEGNALLDAIFRDTRAWMQAQMGSFSREELETIIRAMEALKKMLV